MIRKNENDDFLLYWPRAPLGGYMRFVESIPGECEALFYFKPGYYKILGTQNCSTTTVDGKTETARYLKAKKISCLRYWSSYWYTRILKMLNLSPVYPIVTAGYVVSIE